MRWFASLLTPRNKHKTVSNQQTTKLTIEVTAEQQAELHTKHPELFKAPAGPKHWAEWVCPSDEALGTEPSPEGNYLQFIGSVCMWDKTDLRHLRDFLDTILD